MLQKIKLSTLRVFITGSNLITTTKYQSYSPEKDPSDYPEAVTYLFGLQAGF